MSGPSRDGGMMSEINVTPFVDVMLVLLIIFMVTAPLLVTGVEIDLPSGDTPPLDAANDNLVIGIAADGSYTLSRGSGDARPVTIEQLGANLAEEGKQHPGQPVFVAADGTLPYQKVVDVLELAKGSGVPKVGLMTEPKGK
ncbi:MAG: protein TolR [Deltaproteobacteria bacterium]|nr:protein TolR [Deltaproteobacteria bacterium]